ncbi:MAG: hypothetical protein HY209_05345 [Candidatus Omnitrophica bacterium]|nr:hypothetical protein [Candidatus Omnitrophota bacterium]
MSKQGLKLNTPNHRRIFLVLGAFGVFGFIVSQALAQYSGGSQTFTAEDTIGSDIYKGGAQTTSTFASSASIGSLSYGTATKLVFTTSPSTTKHFLKFERQPVVAIEDVNGNVVAGDNSTQVTIQILNNPGDGALLGTATITAAHGLAQFTDLQINRPGQMYTLKATAAGLIDGISANFDILSGTGAKAVAVWDNASSAFNIYTWVESDNQRVALAAGNTCTITIFKVNGTTETAPSMSLDTTQNWFKSDTEWTPVTPANSYFIDISITSAAACSANAGNICQTYQPLDLVKSTVEAIKTKTDTINWQDIGVIKGSTNTINWQDIGVLKSTDSAIKTVTDTIPTTINWTDIDRMTKAAVNWTDISRQSLVGVNWNDMMVLTTIGINWRDFNTLTKAGVNWNDLGVLTTKGVNWTDFQKFASLGINWTDMDKLFKAGVNWSDFALMGKTSINWYDVAIMSGARINWSSQINWFSLAALTTSMVNWNDLAVLSINHINWDDFGVLSKTGVNWSSVGVLSTANINWADIQTLSKAGVNWGGIATLANSGVNWTNIAQLSLSNVNWTAFDVLGAAGVNWTDIASLSLKGINWTDISTLSTRGVNWDNLRTISTSGVNWTDLNAMTTSGINWLSFGSLSNAGINWAGIDILSDANVNWYGVGQMSTNNINWSNFSELSTANINWEDVNAQSRGGINWIDYASMTHGGVNWFDPALQSTAHINWAGINTLMSRVGSINDVSKKGKTSADAALGYTQDILRDLGLNGVTPDVYTKLKLLENSIEDIKTSAQDLTSGQGNSGNMAKQMIDKLNNILARQAKAAGLQETMSVSQLSAKESKDTQKVNEKLEEITAKVNALREAMQVQDVVVKAWYESE